MKYLLCTSIILMLVVFKVQSQFTSSMLIVSKAKNTTSLVPVNLKAIAVKNTCEISWKAISKIQVSRYELEKSNDAENFNYVTAVPGNKKAITTYSINDKNLTTGLNYYRLKIIDNEGSIYYSSIAAFNMNDVMDEIKIQPTVVSDELLIWLTQNIQINKSTITDLMGKEFSTSKPSLKYSNLATVNVSHLPKGTYKINIISNNGNSTKMQFSKK